MGVATSRNGVPIRLTEERWFHIVENHKEILGRRESLEGIFKAMPHMLSLPAARFWVDYDREADVLYISFERPQKATDSEMTEDGVILR